MASYVSLRYPSMFDNEIIRKKIDSWNIDHVKEIIENIRNERGIIPYAFLFFDTGENGKVTKVGNSHYLGGKKRSLRDVEKGSQRGDIIVAQNMRANNYEYFWENKDLGGVCAYLKRGDVVLDLDFEPVSKLGMS